MDRVSRSALENPARCVFSFFTFFYFFFYFFARKDCDGDEFEFYMEMAPVWWEPLLPSVAAQYRNICPRGRGFWFAEMKDGKKGGDFFGGGGGGRLQRTTPFFFLFRDAVQTLKDSGECRVVVRGD